MLRNRSLFNEIKPVERQLSTKKSGWKMTGKKTLFASLSGLSAIMVLWLGTLSFAAMQDVAAPEQAADQPAAVTAADNTNPSPVSPETADSGATTAPEPDVTTESVPAEATPAEQTPAEQTPAEQTPAEQTPAEQTPVEQTPAEQTPAEQTPAEQTPATETPAEQTPAEQTPAEQTPAEQTPATETPVEPAADANIEEQKQIDLSSLPELPSTQEELPSTNLDETSSDSKENTDKTSVDEKSASMSSLTTGGKTTEPKKPFNWRGIISFGLFILVVVVSGFLASYCSKKFKMLDYKTSYFIIFFFFFGALASTVYGLMTDRMVLGIDLRGGSILVYSVSDKVSAPEEDAANVSSASDPAEKNAVSDESAEKAPKKGLDSQKMEQLKSAIRLRINPSGVLEIAVQERGNNEIKITIPEADAEEVMRIKRIISETGVLKFRIAASRIVPEERELVALAESEEYKDKWEIPYKTDENSDYTGATWTPVVPEEVNQLQASSNQLIFRVSPRDPNVTEMLLLELNDIYEVNGEHVSSVQERIGEKGDPEINFNLSRTGAYRMQNLTGKYKEEGSRTRGREMAILMKDTVYSAPVIQSTIVDSGRITFGHRDTAQGRKELQQEVTDLVSVISAGSLPADISKNPVSELLTGPTLGEDTINRGKTAVIWSGVFVLVFMVAYYGFGGWVASFAVIMNLLLILSVMFGIRQAFTLPGLAGLVLTVGMAVDANVLIFERMKEELAAGSMLRMAIRNGFQRAFSAIFDSNITTMLTAIILYSVGTDQIKGFAVTLLLGVAFSMFTATFVSRIIFQTADKMGWINKKCLNPSVPGLKPIGKTNFDFMSKKRPVLVIGIILIVVGMIGVIGRGKNIFDTDFVGGVDIQVVFNEGQKVSEIREKLSDLPGLTVSEVSLIAQNKEDSTMDNTNFMISSSCPPGIPADAYQNTVKEKLRTAFGDSLSYSDMSAGELKETVVEITNKDGQKEQKAVLESVVQLKPALAHAAVEGYFNDELQELQKNNSETVASLPIIKLTNEEYEKGLQDSPYAEWTVHFENTDKDQANTILNKIVERVKGEPVFPSANTIGASVANEARQKGILAVLGSLVCIILYIGWRFRNVVFGLSAVIALMFNVSITLGAIALSAWAAPFLGFMQIDEFKIGLTVVAAFLTLIGYSLNDTIVLFDRIREVRGKSPNISLEVINTSINQTLSRTILTSLTTLFVALVLYFFGGNGIHTFAFAMSVGIVIGTLCSIFIASPFLNWLLHTKWFDPTVQAKKQGKRWN